MLSRSGSHRKGERTKSVLRTADGGLQPPTGAGEVRDATPLGDGCRNTSHPLRLYAGRPRTPPFVGRSRLRTPAARNVRPNCELPVPTRLGCLSALLVLSFLGRRPVLCVRPLADPRAREPGPAAVHRSWQVTASSRSRGDAAGLAVGSAVPDPDGNHKVPCACLRLRASNDGAFDFYEPLRRVRDHVECHLRDSLSLDAVGAIACFERSYFSTFFRRRVGIAFSDWRGLLRVQKAACLLAESDRCIDDVALQVGLSRRALERLFKRHTGRTPRQFRDGHRPGAPPCMGKLPFGRSNPTT